MPRARLAAPADGPRASDGERRRRDPRRPLAGDERVASAPTSGTRPSLLRGPERGRGVSGAWLLGRSPESARRPGEGRPPRARPGGGGLRDLDHDLREMFRLHEADVGGVAFVPEGLRQRVRRRQGRTILTASLVLATLLIGAVGIRASVGDRRRPAVVPPTPPPSTMTLQG